MQTTKECKWNEKKDYFNYNTTKLFLYMTIGDVTQGDLQPRFFAIHWCAKNWWV